MFLKLSKGPFIQIQMEADLHTVLQVPLHNHYLVEVLLDVLVLELLEALGVPHKLLLQHLQLVSILFCELLPP